MTDKNLEMIVQTFDGFVAKRCAGKQRKAKVALLLANMNWNAYNNFGGRSNYIHPVCMRKRQFFSCDESANFS